MSQFAFAPSKARGSNAGIRVQHVSVVKCIVSKRCWKQDVERFCIIRTKERESGAGQGSPSIKSDLQMAIFPGQSSVALAKKIAAQSVSCYFQLNLVRYR